MNGLIYSTRRMFTNQPVIFWCTEQKWGPYFLQNTIGSPFIPQNFLKNIE